MTQRDTHDPLSILALTTEALPEGAWVQRYAWTPETLRLTGYKHQQRHPARAARHRPLRLDFRPAYRSTAESGGGQPFDVTATLGLSPAKEGQ